MDTRFSVNEIETVLVNYLSGEDSDVETVHRRTTNRGGVVRVCMVSGSTVIIKLWRIRNIKERIKSDIGKSNGLHEWRIHKFLYEHDFKVPQPLGFYNFRTNKGENWEAMVVQDLGMTERSLLYLKNLIKEGFESKIIEMEQFVIDITKKMIQHNTLDIDNQLNNYVVDESFQLYRIDFECARRMHFWNNRSLMFEQMIAKLLSSHIFAVQPNVLRSELFAEKLFSQLEIKHTKQIHIGRMVANSLEYQYRNCGVDSRLNIPGCNR